MLTLHIPAQEYYNSQTEEFENFSACELRLEHSLVSVSKWESKWHKPFLQHLEKKEFTNEETLDYIRCMTITQNVDPSVYKRLTKNHMAVINTYIGAPMTATTFSQADESRSPSKKEILTSELIYYYMTALMIPFECQKWHLNRLLTLINIAAIKNSGDKKMPKGVALKQQAKLNAARRKAHNTKG